MSNPPRPVPNLRPGRHGCSVACECPLDSPYCQSGRLPQQSHGDLSLTSLPQPQPGEQILPSHFAPAQPPFQHDLPRLGTRPAAATAHHRSLPGSDVREMFYYPPSMPLPMSYSPEPPHFSPSTSLIDSAGVGWGGNEDDIPAAAQEYHLSGSSTSDLPRRPSRRPTAKDEATFQCEIKGCGKVFNRSYNFKAHMETHDAKRQYPFPCTEHGCSKKFVRRTDLQRHHQSVHAKERNHGCNFCGRLFARKDTLKRHMEDGCSKRFDIGTLDLYTGDGLDKTNMTDEPLTYEREPSMGEFTPAGAPLYLPPQQGNPAGPFLSAFPRQTTSGGSGYDDDSHDPT